MNQAAQERRTPVIRVRVEQSAGGARLLEFHGAFTIGRADNCEVPIPDEFVSRRHAEVRFEDGAWQIRDLGSRNGIFVDEVRKEYASILRDTVVRFGVEGPSITLAPEVEPEPTETDDPARSSSTDPQVKAYIAHYLTARSDVAQAGERTIMVRRAFSHLQAEQRRRFAWIVGALTVLVIGIAAYAIWQQQQTRGERRLARELFYSIKAMDVEAANLQRLVAGADRAADAQVQRYRERRRRMESDYDRFVATIQAHDSKKTPEEQLILRVARIFGECDVAAPPDFVSEVKNYIRRWQSSPRLTAGIRRAQENGYTAAITKELLRHGLPAQFFYLALQESNFDPWATGPPTHKGIAKGMWQFIPETASRYGLKVGPLVDMRRPDPADDRHHWDRATAAAAQYLNDLYTDDAQASGMLVMACYNWGEDRVLPLVRSMPANPQSRNFWKLLEQYRSKLPQETYDYVFYIVAAAAIGENPRVFHFDFDNPLAHLEAR
jgi:membrane-bound lytic murein transglycosylase D